jgi:hypothetical protein
MYHNDTYLTDIRPILLDWLTNSSRGQNVTDLSLTLANRAQKNLWQMKPWTNLIADVSVTLVNSSYTLPADFGRIIDIWGDLAGNGVPEYWYYAADLYEKGYKIRDSFSMASGHSWAITFYYAQPAPVSMRYQKLLSDFTGVGTEYSFFPANLLLLECQRINTLEKGNMQEKAALDVAFNDHFHEYCNANQWVNCDPTPRLNDREGNALMTDVYSLNGENMTPYSPMPNGYIL